MPSLSDLTKQLVDHLAPSLDVNQRHYAAEYVLKEVSSDTKGSTRREWSDVVSTLNQAQRSARVRVQDDLADALEGCLGVLKRHKEAVGGWEGDMPIQMSNLPQHIQLLLDLSTPPSSSTHTLARRYLTRKADTGPTPDEVLYGQIMSDPFEGDHWGKGHDEEVKHGWTDSESDSEETTSEEEEIVTPLHDQPTGSTRDAEKKIREERIREGEKRLEAARRALESLETGYWRTGGKALSPATEGIFGWQAVTTSASTAALCLAMTGTDAGVKSITSEELQRELLFALSGRSGLLLNVDDNGKAKVTNDHPQVLTFTPAALRGILGRVAGRASQAATIRAFTIDTFALSTTVTGPRSSKTLQAFASACSGFMQDFDSWISEIEMAMVRGTTSTSPIPSTALALCRDVDEKYGSQLDDLESLLPLADDAHTLLDAIYTLYSSPAHLSARRHLLELFLATVEPTWGSLGDWLIDGMPLPSSMSGDVETIHTHLEEDERLLEPDYFIKRDRDVSWTDEDFWEAGYIAPEDEWPEWMGETRDMVLEAGKARGLLKGLLGNAGDAGRWMTLRKLVDEFSLGAPMSVINFGHLIRDALEPRCRITMFQLRRVLEEDCGLDQHLDAIEGVMYLQAHDAMDRWLSGLYDQIREEKRWSDMQTLTSSLRDAIEASDSAWMNPSAIRIFPKKKRPNLIRETSASHMKTIRDLGGLQVGYNVPFPLSVLFTSTSLGLRSQVFGFLVQLDIARRAVHARIAIDRSSSWNETHKLSWILDTIWTWITQRVIEVQRAVYRERLAKTSSLKEMISLELEHTRRIRDFCCLHDHTADLHAQIIALCGIALTGHRVGDDHVSSEVELNERVEAIRREVEALALDGGSTAEEEDRRAVWAMLSFALEDWR